MSKRLQVLVEPKEYRLFQHIAEEKGLSLGEWVRQILRRFAQSASIKDPQTKIDQIRKASRHEFPSGDIGQILAEIEKGYLE